MRCFSFAYGTAFGHTLQVSARLSGDDLGDWLGMIDVEAFAAGDLELPRVEAQLFENRCVDFGNVVAILDGMKTSTLRTRRAAKLAGNDDECFIDNTALVEQAQPMPRPLQKSGHAEIESIAITVKD
jgi:hypothetical protein